MTIRRFFVNKQNIDKHQIIVSGDEHNHLKNVLRLTSGMPIIVVCGDGYDYYANIAQVAKNQTLCNITSTEPNVADPKKNVTVYQALTKKDALYNLVPKLTELGVSQMVLLNTTNVTAKDKATKTEKLQTITEQSVKQCKRSKPMGIKPAISVAQMVKQFGEYDLVLFANETELNVTLAQALNGKQNVNNVAIIIGSEGGFTPQEIKQITEGGAISITLGKRILRVETACVAVAAVVINAIE